MPDYYHTIKTPTESVYKDKGSKFLAFAYPVTSEEEIKEILQKVRKKYHDARHHCYAWTLGPKREPQRANDDGEPANTAGKPILGQIYSFDYTNILIVVVRYFGGTLLGVGGLITAYRSAAKLALNEAQPRKIYICNTYSIYFSYPEMNIVMRLVKDLDLTIIEQIFDSDCKLKLEVKMKDETRFNNYFVPHPAIRVTKE